MRKNILDTFKHEPGIYAIINKYDNKIYIGQSSDMKNRIYTHITALKKGKHYKLEMQNDYTKHSDYFYFIPLEYISGQFERMDTEDYYIQLLYILNYKMYNNIPECVSNGIANGFIKTLVLRNEGFKRINGIINI